MTTKGDISEARILAYKALERVRRDDSFANEVIDKIIDTSDASNADKAFATRLVLGVVATRGALDEVIRRFVDKPQELKGKLRTALRISAYEIIYLNKNGYAAVDQCVNLVKLIQPRATGLANAVMRKIDAASKDFPFGSPESDLKAYSLKHAFPEWLVKMLISVMGKKEADEFVRASNTPSPVYIHLNSIKCDDGIVSILHEIDEFLEEVRIAGVDVLNCYKLSSSKCVASKRFIEIISSGKALVSDASAQFISQIACKSVIASKPDRDLSCLELCSGRGTKTILLQSMLNNLRGSQFDRYVALDNIEFKSKLLKKRAKDYGVNIDEALCCDATDLENAVGNELFDLVFLDAPCSGIGTMRRHPEIRWRVSPKTISDNAKLDIELIKEASKHVECCGILIYATCTVASEENENVVERFLDAEEGRDFEIIPIDEKPFLLTKLREDGYDSHFCSILRRKELR